MLRALLAGAAIAGAIVACSFTGPPAAGLGGDGGPRDAHDAIDAPRDDGSPAIDARPTDAASAIDAAADATANSGCGGNPGPCLAAGGMCVGATCTITVLTSLPVVCPANMPCDVECVVDGACQGGIDCSAATTCLIDCVANNTCVSGALRGSTQTSVLCKGVNTCDNVALSAPNSSGSCVAHCCGAGACGSNLTTSHCTTQMSGC
jgi:hypothetical protein